MTATCKTCRFWGRTYDDGAVKDCERVGHIQAESGPQAFFIRAWADDDQGLETALMTGEDFSCSHYQPDEDAAS